MDKVELTTCQHTNLTLKLGGYVCTNEDCRKVIYLPSPTPISWPKKKECTRHQLATDTPNGPDHCITCSQVEMFNKGIELCEKALSSKNVSAQDEKDIRIKYQDIVYKICKLFDGIGIENKCTIDEVVEKVKALKLSCKDVSDIEEAEIFNKGFAAGVKSVSGRELSPLDEKRLAEFLWITPNGCKPMSIIESELRAKFICDKFGLPEPKPEVSESDFHETVRIAINDFMINEGEIKFTPHPRNSSRILVDTIARAISQRLNPPKLGNEVTDKCWGQKIADNDNDYRCGSEDPN